MARPKSIQRCYFDADLLRILERMKREKLTYVDLAIEYDMSLPAVRAAVRDSSYARAIERARIERRHSNERKLKND